MTQLIDDVLKRDEEERLRQEAAGVRGISFAGVDIADMQRRIREATAAWLATETDARTAATTATAAMRGDPYAAWLGLDTVEFTMPTMRDGTEYNAPMARVRPL